MKIKNIIWFIYYSKDIWKIKILLDLFLIIIIDEKYKIIFDLFFIVIIIDEK